MNDFTQLFLIALATSFLLEYWLARRQLRHVLEHRQEVPAAFKETVSKEAHQKAADYTVDKSRVANLDRLVGVGLLLALTLGGGINVVEGWIQPLNLSPLLSGVLLIMASVFLAVLK